MIVIRQIIYTTCFSVVAGEMLCYIIPSESLKKTVKFSVILLCLLSLLTLHGKITFNFDIFNLDNYFADNENTEQFDDYIAEKQIDIIKKEISNDLKNRFEQNKIVIENINISIMKKDNNIENIFCEIYLKNEDKDSYINKRNLILKDFEFDVTEYYISEK